MTRHAASIVFLLSTLLCGSCGGGGGGGGGGTGTLQLDATDAPFAHDIVTQARISVTKILIHDDANADSGFLTLYDGPPQELDLLNLQDGVKQTLVNATLPVGSYRQLRLIVSDASLELTNGNVYSTANGNLDLTSQGTSGFKVFIEPPVQVSSQVGRTLLLDFDLTKTFHPIPSNDPLNATSYKLQPVIHVANLSDTGELRGMVTHDDGTGQQVGVASATVYILPPGEQDPNNSVASTGTTAKGAYAVLGLAPGVYDVLATHGAEQGRVDGQQVFVGNVTVVDVVIQ
jgi:uncharacterized protein DUF4382